MKSANSITQWQWNNIDLFFLYRREMAENSAATNLEPVTASDPGKQFINCFHYISQTVRKTAKMVLLFHLNLTAWRNLESINLTLSLRCLPRLNNNLTPSYSERYSGCVCREGNDYILIGVAYCSKDILINKGRFNPKLRTKAAHWTLYNKPLANYISWDS